MENQKSLEIRQIPFIALFAGLTSIFGYIQIPLPFSPVPITAQTLAVMLAGSILPPKSAFLSMLVFLLLGALGLPVFHGGSSGIGILFGPTGGFLISWPIAAYIMALINKKLKPNFAYTFLLNILGGIIIVYAIGVPYLAYSTKIGIRAAILSGALPFIAGDLLKVFLATTLALSIRKALKM